MAAAWLTVPAALHTEKVKDIFIRDDGSPQKLCDFRHVTQESCASISLIYKTDSGLWLGFNKVIDVSPLHRIWSIGVQ